MTTNLKTTFAESLSSTAKVAYSTGYSFHMDCYPNATESEAHQAGLDEMARIDRIRKTAKKPQTWVDITTGKKFKATI
jgi:hypothetical protein